MLTDSGQAQNDRSGFACCLGTTLTRVSSEKFPSSKARVMGAEKAQVVPPAAEESVMGEVWKSHSILGQCLETWHSDVTVRIEIPVDFCMMIQSNYFCSNSLAPRLGQGQAHLHSL